MNARTINFSDIECEYIEHMGTDKKVTNVARVSFSKWDDNEELTSGDKGLLNYLATGLPASDRNDWEKMAKASTHWTPFAHNFLSVRVKVPIFCARQLHKHVVGLVINEESRRYIKSDVELWLPTEVHKAPENAKQGASKEIYNNLIDWANDWRDDRELSAVNLIQESSISSIKAYYQMLDTGVAPEEARMVLPLNTMVTWIWSGSLLAFNRVYQLRSDSHAQISATQEFANKLGKVLYECWPESMKALNYGKEI